MRIVPVIISAVITISLVIVLDSQLSVKGSKTPRLGFFLSPQKGFWQNADPVNEQYNNQISNRKLKGNTDVYFDERLVPHIYADNDADAYFAVGYIHAKFRLWQMDFQTYAAAGRLSEIMGDSTSGTNFFNIDKYFRRLGMVYAAENSLKAAEANADTKAAYDAYTAGVNSYIDNITEANYPFEYKLLNYKPEHWTNLKSALFLKYMAYDLAGYEQDFEMTNARSYFTNSQFEKLYPYEQDSVSPIIPKGTKFGKPGIRLKVPVDADSLYYSFKTPAVVPAKPIVPNKNNGSNNWAVAGSKTVSGRPILCNDPHLGLNLPCLWFELQISTPGNNVYGASFPGAPFVIIGYNDNCAWGVTNASRDVKDYYEVKFRDSTMNEYWYNGEWKQATHRKEIIKIKGKSNDVEDIPMTVFGPVIYDKDYADKLHSNKAYAVHWQAHNASNDGLAFLLLDKCTNYNDYLKAIRHFECPGQNFVFASKSGDIAIRQEGFFPALWRRQGNFIMSGETDAYRWQGIIPDSENLVMRNPLRGFVSSANQYPYDNTYPYYLAGSYEPYRGFIINRELSNMQHVTTAKMQYLQTNNYNVFAEMARPVLLKNIQTKQLNEEEKKYLDTFKYWSLQNNANETGASVFTAWWDSLMTCMYNDELKQSNLPMPDVSHSTLLESLLRDTAYEFADDINTPQKETVSDIVLKSFKQIIPVLRNADESNKLAWGIFKDDNFKHLLRIPALSRYNINTGGGVHIINAYYKNHGPGWRMIVELTDDVNAYGIYPGGQSGNPGSKFYANTIDDWAAGKYYKLHVYKKEEFNQTNILGKISFSNH